MKACSKRNDFAVFIPALLIVGIVVCALIYRSNVQLHNTSLRNIILDEPGYEQSRLLLSKIENKIDILKLYSHRISNVDWRDYEHVLPEINESAKEYGFSYVTVVGPDGIFYDESKKAIDISETEIYKSSINGLSVFKKADIFSYKCFAYAVPFVVNGTLEGAVIGLVSEKDMIELLRTCNLEQNSHILVFNSEGEIIISNDKIPHFEAESNVFSTLDFLLDEGDIKRYSTNEVNNSSDMIFESEHGYFLVFPIGLDGLNMLKYVDLSDAESEHSLRNLKALAAYIMIIFFSVFLSIFIILSNKSRFKKLNEANKKSVRAYSIDPLTNLYSKSGFESKLKNSLIKIPKDNVCAIVSFEVVSFRSYNTLYGFEAGDELLKTIANIVRSFMKENDIAGRLYADHFVWLVNRASDEEIFETLRNAVRVAKNCGLPFFLCGGIYIIEDRSVEVKKMIDNASIAKDTIKYKFSTGIAIYNDSMLECQIEDAELVGNMMRGLENGEFVDYYQPKYNMSDECISGSEALVRWKRPNGEIIMPGRFIELFEKNGFIRKLDFYMFEKACQTIKGLQDKGINIVPISVNFSRVHLYDSHFPQRIFNIAKKYGVDTKYLEIELTESAFLLEAEILDVVVDQLHEYGFSVAIDDFGSGFSSLNMLKDVEVDTLKIDMKFLEGFERGGKVGTVVTSVIRMAKWLAIPVVAEGVETKEQVEFLKTLGCDMVQGYYYSCPVTRNDFETMLKSNDAIHILKDKPAAVTLDSINAVMGGDSLVTALLDGILGGFGLYEFAEGRLEAIRVNRAYCEMLEYPDMSSFREHSLNVLTQVHPADLEKFLEACRKAISTGKVQKCITRRYSYSGKVLQLKGYIKHLGGTLERPLICISFLDSTELMRDQKEKELNKYSNALYGIFDEIYEFNYTANTFRIISNARKKNFGDDQDLNMVETYWLNNRIYLDDREKIKKLIVAARTGKLELPVTVEYRVIERDVIRWKISSMVSVFGGSYLFCVLDITKKKQIESFVKNVGNIHNRIEFDMTTGLLNATTAETMINEQLGMHEGAYSVLMLLSLDNLRDVKESYGKPLAERYIKDAAFRIKSLFREQDIIGRYDEDKFIIFAKGMSSTAALSKAKKVYNYVCDIFLPDLIQVECSIGIYTDVQNYTEAFVKAEAAMKEAQKSAIEKYRIFIEDEKAD